MDGRLSQVGTEIRKLGLRRLLNVAYAYVVEGLTGSQRAEVDRDLLHFGEEMWRPMLGERRMRETWGRTPEDIAAQRAMEALMSGGG